MHDNKVRLSRDVLAKADQIAVEWGLKNARAAVEAVFRCYCDEYLQGHREGVVVPKPAGHKPARPKPESAIASHSCDALDALDELLAL
ncbi:hypothetical protein C7271_20685 [filamentous cyanobacterium CCP5]|nr:hypothetical protein C7271_20685 [filamentous cyanobacterium CCP5]